MKIGRVRMDLGVRALEWQAALQRLFQAGHPSDFMQAAVLTQNRVSM